MCGFSIIVHYLKQNKKNQKKKNQFREHGYVHTTYLTVNMVFCRENDICNVFTKFKKNY